MKCVLDSSVAFKSLVLEQHSPKAIQLVQDYYQSLHEFIAPSVFSHELAHALTRAERQGRLSTGEAIQHWAAFMLQPPLLVDDQPLIERGIEIASFHRIGVYDCVYVALAEQEGCELITADDKLVRNLQSHFPFIVDLSTLP
jgi:predicted nucleic acid-binding protein